MGIKDRATKAAAGAVSIAVATSGLSGCRDNGAVDPAPPPLECDAVGEGQTLYTEAALAGSNRVLVSVQHAGYWGWTVDSVRMVSGGSLHDVLLPDPNNPYDGLTFVIEFDEAATSAAVTVYGKLSDPVTTCGFTRQFTVTADAVVSSVTSSDLDELPLPSRQPVAIVLLEHSGGVATLEARSSFGGEKRLTWSVTDGGLTVLDDGRATWRLPQSRGVYQAEVVADFGDGGLAFDALAIEVL